LTAAEQRIQANTLAIAAVGQRTDALQEGLTQTAARLERGEEALLLTRERLERVQSALEGHEGRLSHHDEALTTASDKLVQLQTALKQQEERLSRNEAEDEKISATAREALERALAAGKLAEGKLVYETALSETFLGFRLNQTKLSPEARQALKDLANKLLAENRNVYLEIQGHTDNTGPAEFNQRLGLQRAEVVRDFLQQSGIPLHRLSVISYGARLPIASNATREGRSRNRRVVVVVLK
jgi:outer membrane protein OmpA-like peptidoglycan-associated protein